jgi:peptidoglycan DL-endopeptidase CwlO
MIFLVPAIVMIVTPCIHGQLIDPIILLDVRTRPARIGPEDLTDFGMLPESRRRLIEGALATARESWWLPYVAGGATPKAGGFDCSGAMYFVMRRIGLEPPRSSAAQMEWLKKHDRFHEISALAKDTRHDSLASLMPGDLLFWARTDPSGKPRVHHVAMYLGTEKSDGRPVMINSTDGRSYRGQVANGYGVYDFRVPKAESPSKLVGYGSPPGIGDD